LLKKRRKDGKKERKKEERRKKKEERKRREGKGIFGGGGDRQWVMGSWTYNSIQSITVQTTALNKPRKSQPSVRHWGERE
jgi:hypothetical protein